MSFSAAVRRFALPNRRWFQFSLRSLLVLFTVFGVWLGLHIRSARRQQQAVAAIKAYGGWVYYDFQKYNTRTGAFDPKAETWAPRWLVSRSGLDLFHDVEAVNLVFNDDTAQRLDNNNLTADAIPHLSALPHVRALYLQKTQVTDEGMKVIGGLKNLEVLLVWDASEITDAGTVHLQGLERLEQLHLSNARITDESLKTFSRLPRLIGLSLQGNRFTDKGLAYLQGMQQLETLWIGLGDPQITDTGLAHLKNLTNLRQLDLQNTRVTAKGLEQLTGLQNLKMIVLNMNVGDLTQVVQAMPNCKIQ